MKADEIGCCRVWMKGDVASFILHPEEWPRLQRTFLSGDAIFEARATYGDPIVLRMANAVAINFQCVEVTREIIADRKADKAKEAIEGGE